jgi:hypothetical protein
MAAYQPVVRVCGVQTRYKLEDYLSLCFESYYLRCFGEAGNASQAGI